jgi:hypothetical protein
LIGDRELLQQREGRWLHLKKDIKSWKGQHIWHLSKNGKKVMWPSKVIATFMSLYIMAIKRPVTKLEMGKSDCDMSPLLGCHIIKKVFEYFGRIKTKSSKLLRAKKKGHRKFWKNTVTSLSLRGSQKITGTYNRYISTAANAIVCCMNTYYLFYIYSSSNDSS